MPKISVVLPILTPTPMLRAMTEFCIKTLRAHASYPFELVIVEAQGSHFHLAGDRYLSFPEKIGQVKEINAGIDAATGDFIVFTGNDIIAPKGWDSELLKPFELYKDCGASCLAAGEPGNPWIGSREPIDMIVEGMYSPFMMFRRGWRYSEEYGRIFQDSDLIMRMYTADPPLRSYRNNRASVIHFNRMTNDNVDVVAHNEQLEKDARTFYRKWGKSPLWMFGMMKGVHLRYGQEHEAWFRNRQYDQ